MASTDTNTTSTNLLATCAVAAGVVLTQEGGWLHIKTPFNRDFVEALKSQVPYSLRRRVQRMWDGESRVWKVRPTWQPTVTDLCVRYYPVPRQSEPEVVAAPARQRREESRFEQLQRERDAAFADLESVRRTVQRLQRQVQSQSRQLQREQREASAAAVLRAQNRDLERQLAAARQGRSGGVGQIRQLVSRATATRTSARVSAPAPMPTPDPPAAPREIVPRWVGLDLDEGATVEAQPVAPNARFVDMELDASVAAPSSTDVPTNGRFVDMELD